MLIGVTRTAATIATMIALAGCSPSAPTEGAAPGEPSSYVALCARALTNVQYATHQLEGADLVPTDPVVLQAGPPARVQCGIAQGTYIGAVTFDAVCGDWESSGCARVTAAVMDGRVVYISNEARAALRDAAHRHHRHRA